MDETTVQDIQLQTVVDGVEIAHVGDEHADAEIWYNEPHGDVIYADRGCTPNPARAARILQFYRESQQFPVEKRNVTWRGLKMLNACIDHNEFMHCRRRATDTQELLLKTIIESACELDYYHRTWSLRGLYMNPQEILALVNAMLELHFQHYRTWIGKLTCDDLMKAVQETREIMTTYDGEDPLCVGEWLSDEPHGTKPYTVLCRFVAMIVSHRVKNEKDTYPCDNVLALMQHPLPRVFKNIVHRNLLDLIATYPPSSMIKYFAPGNLTICVHDGTWSVQVEPRNYNSHETVRSMLQHALDHIQEHGEEMRKLSLAQNVDLSLLNSILPPLATEE